MVPYEQFRLMKRRTHQGSAPNTALTLVFERGLSPMAAWSERLYLTQAEVAEALELQAKQFRW